MNWAAYNNIIITNEKAVEKRAEPEVIDNEDLIDHDVAFFGNNRSACSFLEVSAIQLTFSLKTTKKAKIRVITT